MDHIPAEEFPAVGEAAHAVVQEAMDTRVGGGGLPENVDPVMVAGDGTITAGTYSQTKEFNGGFTVIDVTSREAAVEWAAKDRGRLPLCSRDPRVRARLSGGQLSEAPNRPHAQGPDRRSPGPALGMSLRTRDGPLGCPRCWSIGLRRLRR